MLRRLVALSLFVVAVPAAAQDTDFCADRPGLGTPSCTMPPGQVMAEIGLAEWDHLADPATIEGDASYGGVLVRVGIDDRTELEAGLGGYGTARTRDRISGAVSRSHGLGDATIALRRSISGPGGPVAVHVFATLPTGAAGIGAGDWGGGVLVPIDLQLPSGLELDLTPEVDAAVNASGSGRHLAWGGVIGLAHGLGRKVTLAGEFGTWRDNDPSGHATDARVALSLAWQAGKDWQIDLEGDAGLSAAAPRHSLLIGMARRF
ncbi:MAG: transporter [Novosphingobium sp.]